MSFKDKVYGRTEAPGTDERRTKTDHNSTPLLPASKHLLIKSKKGGKDFYTILNKNLDKPTSKYKWNHVYNIEEKTWKEIYSFAF